jgi:hypothetical protein
VDELLTQDQLTDVRQLSAQAAESYLLSGMASD